MTARVDLARRERFDALVGEVYQPLLRYLRRRLPREAGPDAAHDLLGDVLLVMWRRAEDIPEQAATAWCYGVARGCLANAHRAAGRQHRLLGRLRREPTSASSTADQATDDDIDDPHLAEAFSRLSPPDQEILRLWAWEQLPPREMAVALGISANAASVRLHRATQRLRATLRTADKAPPHTGKERRSSGQVEGRQDKEAPR